MFIHIAGGYSVNILVKLASSIVMLVMLIVVVGGVPTASARTPTYWFTKVDYSCDKIRSFLIDTGAFRFQFLHDNSPLIRTLVFSCHRNFNYMFVITPYSAGIPNMYSGTINLYSGPISFRSCSVSGLISATAPVISLTARTFLSCGNGVLGYMYVTIYPPEAVY